MPKHLLLIALGPIQDFIASARRTRDLWFGSYLLSETSKAVANSLADTEGIESLIFPAPSDQKDLHPNSVLNVSNLILGQVTGDPKTLAEKAQVAANELLQHYLKEAIDFVKGKSGTLDSEDRATKQVEELLEFYWVAVPLADENDYQDQRKRLVQLMAARKATRNFGLPDGVSIGIPKSSLDGQRESIIPSNKYAKRGDSSAEREAKAQKIYRQYRARPAEQLSGVDLMKRLAGLAQQDRFYSTSHMAAIPLLECIRHIYEADPPRRTEMQKSVRAFLETKDSNERSIWLEDRLETIEYDHPVFKNYDGRILFVDRLRDLVDKENEGLARDSLKALLRKVTLEDPAHPESSQSPNPYYVLIHGDGDHMGAAISRLKRPHDHRQFSYRLSQFAGEATRIVDKAGGKIVFAGGDDVLAFLPLHTSLSACEALAKKFESLMNTFPTEGNVTPTLSIGMVVAHHLEPLQDVLQWAKAGESTAKKTLGRGAISITLAKRGGSDRMVGGSWKDRILSGQKEQSFITRFNELIWLHRTDRVPDGAGYELLLTSRQMAHLPKVALTKEAVRILARKRDKDGNKLDPAVRKQLEQYADSLGLETLANELIVAAEFAAAMDLALIPLPQPTEVLA